MPNILLLRAKIMHIVAASTHVVNLNSKLGPRIMCLIGTSWIGVFYYTLQQLLGEIRGFDLADKRRDSCCVLMLVHQNFTSTACLMERWIWIGY